MMSGKCLDLGSRALQIIWSRYVHINWKIEKLGSNRLTSCCPKHINNDATTFKPFKISHTLQHQNFFPFSFYSFECILFLLFPTSVQKSSTAGACNHWPSIGEFPFCQVDLSVLNAKQEVICIHLGNTYRVALKLALHSAPFGVAKLGDELSLSGLG